MLVVLRGNSGSGKSAVARAVRERVERVALVQQDVVRRHVLGEGDVAGGVNIGLLEAMARYALSHRYAVILEGILNAARYGDMLRRLALDHPAAFFYLDVSFEETARRHGTRPEAAKFTVEAMRRWYRTRALLGYPVERIIPESSSLTATADLLPAALVV
ncbi:AAA family ATPase [Kutzneria sp. NPDC051319]|uniref:AAA family ATPase n=1 Tax=Kutzneria sp. NPDC051319 TaxID=3155047 RepID=UPI00342F227B